MYMYELLYPFKFYRFQSSKQRIYKRIIIKIQIQHLIALNSESCIIQKQNISFQGIFYQNKKITKNKFAYYKLFFASSIISNQTFFKRNYPIYRRLLMKDEGIRCPYVILFCYQLSNDHHCFLIKYKEIDMEYFLSMTIVIQVIQFDDANHAVFSFIANFVRIIQKDKMVKTKVKQQWTQDQKNLLRELYPRYSSKKWKMISSEMILKGFQRTELECREKWINFLDPSLNNKDWSEEQLQSLYHLHDKHGTRWCYIQKQLNRTQNKIKNKFYGTIRNYLRFVVNTFCHRRSCLNPQISKISPNLLNDLYNSQNVFDFLKGEIKKMINRMRFKIDKKTLQNRIKDRQDVYRQLLGVLSGLFKCSFSLKSTIDKVQSDSQQFENLQQQSQIAQVDSNNYLQQVKEKLKKIKKQQTQTGIRSNAKTHRNKAIIANSQTLSKNQGIKHTLKLEHNQGIKLQQIDLSQRIFKVPKSEQKAQTIHNSPNIMVKQNYYPFQQHNDQMLRNNIFLFSKGQTTKQDPNQQEFHYDLLKNYQLSPQAFILSSLFNFLVKSQAK